MKNDTKGMLLGLLGVGAFGLTLPATKFVIPYLDPIFIGLGRAVLATLVAALLLLWFRQKIPGKRQIGRLVIVALGVVIGFPVFSTWAMLHVPASHGAVVFGVLPLATALVAVLVGNERPSIAFWAVGFAGCLTVITYAFLQGAGSFHLADLALVAALVSAAIGYAVGAKLSNELGGWQVICWALVLSFPVIIWPTINHAPHTFPNLPASAYASFLYLALISQLLAFFVWYKALALGGISRVSQTQLLQPFVTILASVLFLGEVIDITTTAFVIIVGSLVWFGKRMPINTVAR